MIIGTLCLDTRAIIQLEEAGVGTLTRERESRAPTREAASLARRSTEGASGARQALSSHLCLAAVSEGSCRAGPGAVSP